ncbi:hypothetical protein HIM_08721 [Hirsutella minnesotensis 3608]|uniref:RING-type domain-containing protein n=1 Tax=Hirsutella minnesotensis 3608 TaxID=1043627 RepID=A0A0F7ZH20_9HYPO|nr:hypothetical protein HIM_08721 [Hirsutella minnesotensis 3608]
MRRSIRNPFAWALRQPALIDRLPLDEPHQFVVDPPVRQRGPSLRTRVVVWGKRASKGIYRRTRAKFEPKPEPRRVHTRPSYTRPPLPPTDYLPPRIESVSSEGSFLGTASPHSENPVQPLPNPDSPQHAGASSGHPTTTWASPSLTDHQDSQAAVAGPLNPNRRGSSAVASANTAITSANTAITSTNTAVEDPDAITPAPLEASFPAGAALPAVEVERNNHQCYICGYDVGRPKGLVDVTEYTTYLPCGHAFGHDCVYLGMKDPNTRNRCAVCNAPLRHKCEHLTYPRRTFPSQVFDDRNAAVLPTNYAFCQTTHGQSRYRAIEKKAKRATGAEPRMNGPNIQTHPLVAIAIHQVFKHRCRRAEKKLNEEQMADWETAWTYFHS